MPDLFDFADARAKGDLGMTRASDHAERETPGWAEDALAAVRRGVASISGEFTFERLRLLVQSEVDDPPDLRAWGSVARRAAKLGIIRRTGRYAPRASGNLTPAMLYDVPTPEATDG